MHIFHRRNNSTYTINTMKYLTIHTSKRNFYSQNASIKCNLVCTCATILWGYIEYMYVILSPWGSNWISFIGKMWSDRYTVAESRLGIGFLVRFNTKKIFFEIYLSQKLRLILVLDLSLRRWVIIISILFLFPILHWI